ncbi:MAG: PIN domain-containing protein [Micrococcales bacterium]|nr:PIN domain-containing protein [Micrococcales bacterium]
MILLDTSVLLALPDLEVPDGPLAVSAVSYAELAFGLRVARSAEQARARRAHLAFLDSLGWEWLPFDRAAGDGYGVMAAAVRENRPAHARSKDIMLAGHAYALGAALATLNPRDFDPVAPLVPVVVPASRGKAPHAE